MIQNTQWTTPPTYLSEDTTVAMGVLVSRYSEEMKNWLNQLQQSIIADINEMKKNASTNNRS
jgi:hypothetical protein